MLRVKMNHNFENSTKDILALPQETSGRKIETSKNSGDEVIVAARAKDFAGEVSVAGVKYVFHVDAGIIRKLIWAGIVLFSISFTVYQIQERIRYFLRYPTAVNLRMNYEPRMRFPTVTICNENIVDRSEVSKLGEDVVQLIEKMYPSNPDESEPFNFTTYDFSTIPNFGEIYETIAQPKEKAIIDCTFRNQQCNSSFFKTVATNIGYCFQFNTEEQNFYLEQAGSVDSLRLTLFVDQDNYLVQSSLSAGFRVLLHDPEDVPLMAEWGFKIAPGVLTQASLTVRETTQLPHPHGDCMDRENYTVTQCLNLCEAKYVIKHCNCRESFHPGNATICNPNQRYECADHKKGEYIKNNVANECDCPHQCKKTYYFTDLSWSPPSRQILNGITKMIDPTGVYNVKPEDIMLNYGILEIFFSELSFEKMETIKAYDLLSLICDIGGALGLLLGSTILTIFEVLDFAIVTGADYLSFKRYKTRVSANHHSR